MVKFTHCVSHALALMISCVFFFQGFGFTLHFEVGNTFDATIREEIPSKAIVSELKKHSARTAECSMKKLNIITCFGELSLPGDTLFVDSTFMTSLTVFATPDDPLDIPSDSSNSLSSYLDNADTLLVNATYMRIDTSAVDSLYLQLEALSNSSIIASGGWMYSEQGVMSSFTVAKAGRMVKVNFGRHAYCGSVAVRIRAYSNGVLVDETYNTLNL